MSDVPKLLGEFVDALAAGEAPEARDYIARTENDQERAELASGIEAALDLVVDHLRHPRTADGSFVLGVPAERIARAAQVIWPEALPAWRTAAGLTREQLAERTLTAGGIESDAAGVAAAGRWIDAIEAGAETVRSVSERARTAIADVLGVAGELFDAAGDFEAQGGVAFRADGDLETQEVAMGLADLAATIDAAMPEDQASAAVDDWFSA